MIIWRHYYYNIINVNCNKWRWLCVLDIWILDSISRLYVYALWWCFAINFYPVRSDTVRRILWRELRNGRCKNSIIAGRKYVELSRNNCIVPSTNESCTVVHSTACVYAQYAHNTHGTFPISDGHCHLPRELAQIIKIIIVIVI